MNGRRIRDDQDNLVGHPYDILNQRANRLEIMISFFRDILSVWTNERASEMCRESLAGRQRLSIPARRPRKDEREDSGCHSGC